MLHNKLLRVIQAHLVGFSTNIVLSCKRFCLFCLFRTSLSFAGCLVQLVSTYFPNRVIYRAHRRFIGLNRHQLKRKLIDIRRGEGGEERRGGPLWSPASCSLCSHVEERDYTPTTGRP